MKILSSVYATWFVCSICFLVPSTALATGKKSAKPKPARVAPTKAKPDNSEMETYQGHLIQGDQGFTLQVNHDNTASLKWTDDKGMTVLFTGTYTGQDGTYTIHLTPKDPPANSHTTSFTLYTHAIGGEEQAAFSPNKSTIRQRVPSITLMEVDGGNISLHPPKRRVKKNIKSKRRTTKRKRVIHRTPPVHYIY